MESREMGAWNPPLVLTANCHNHSILVMSANLQQMTTVVGDGKSGHRDGGGTTQRVRVCVRYWHLLHPHAERRPARGEHAHW